MGYQRNGGRSLGGGGGRGGVAVVRCSCSEEEVKISFKSVGDDRRLRLVFGRRWFGECFSFIDHLICKISLVTNF